MTVSLLALVLPLTSTRALAFAPSEGSGVEPNRIEHFHMPEQLRMRHLPAWEEFTQGDGAGWQARFDEVEDTTRRAWGPGIPMADVSDEAGVEASLRAFFADNAGLVGVDDSELELRAAGYSESNDTWYVDFDRMIAGVPVWRGGVTARIHGGELVMFGIETYPGVRSLPKPTVSASDAEAVAQLEGPAAMADHTDVTSSLVALPWDRDGGVVVRLCWEVHSHTDAPVGDWVTHVDAQTGERLNTYNTVRFFTGTVQGTHDTRTVDGSYTTSVLPLAKFTGSGGTTVNADEYGAVTLADDETWTTTLSGSYVTVRNQAGSNGSLSVTNSSPVWTTAAATQAEIDTYKFATNIRAWGLLIDPSNGMSSDSLTAKVNANSSCNAYYDGNINFYSAGGGCNNTGQISDVVYHEWGHGFHYYALEAGSYDGSMSEGIGDTVATFQTHDSEIGPYFYTSGGPVRDVSDLRVYPADMDGEVHDEGMIFGGSVWDLWGELLTTYGESRSDSGDAWLTVNTLLANGIKAGPTIPEVYDEFVLADDDNNNTADGTPHLCELLDAFGRHGLGPGGDSALIGIDHAALGNQRADSVIPLSGTVINLAPSCTDFTLTSATIRYSTDDGSSWESLPAVVSGDTFSADLPGFPAGTIVTYYITARADDGTQVSLPAGEDIAPYTFYVGALTEVWCASLDDDDGGFTHELIDGRDQEGADDWSWGRPGGLAEDPSEAYAGNKVWGNDLGGGNYNGEYQTSIENRLSSPEIDVGANTELILQYRRWLNVEDGVYDQASILANDATVWTNHASSESVGDEQTQDDEWMLHTVRLSSVASPLTVAWDLSSDGGLEFGGWNLDEVCVYAPAEALDTGGDDTSGDNGGNGGNGDNGGNGGDNSGSTDTGDNPKIAVNGGCGCASAPAVPWSAAGLLIAMVAVRRKRVG